MNGSFFVCAVVTPNFTHMKHMNMNSMQLYMYQYTNACGVQNFHNNNNNNKNYIFLKTIIVRRPNVYCKTVLLLHPNHTDMILRAKKNRIKKILNTLIRADFNFNRSCKKKKRMNECVYKMKLYML